MSERRKFVPSGRYFIGIGAEIRLIFFSCHIAQIRILSKIFSEDLLNFQQYYLAWEVYLGDELQDVKIQVWLDKIWSEYLQDLFSGSFSFFIDLYFYWIFRVEFDGDWVHQTHLDMLYALLHWYLLSTHFFSLCWGLMTGWWIWDCISDIWDCKIFII